MEEQFYCPGCGESVRASKEQLENAEKQANYYAKEQQTSIAYWKEGDEYRFESAFTAFANGHAGPGVRVVSQYNDLATY